MLKKYLQMLMLYLALGVTGQDGGDDQGGTGDGAAGGEGEGDAGDSGDGEGDAGGAGEGEGAAPGDDLDSLLDLVETPGTGGRPASESGRENAEVREARERAQRETEARIRAEAERDLLRRGNQPGADDEARRLFDQEETILRDPNATDVERWQVRSNRTLRANTKAATDATNAANRALMEAADGRDRTQFDRLATTKPKVHKLYESRVEDELQKMRGRGENAPRMAILQFLIGKDVIEGKVRSKPARKAAAAGAGNEEQNTGVDRGKSPGARSDVSAKARQTERQKREKRLEGVRI